MTEQTRSYDMFGSCPRCGSGLHRNLNAIGLTICTRCSWVESRNQSATRVRNENRTITMMAVSALALLLVVAHWINWGGHALEIPLLKLGQLTGTLSAKSYNQLAEICAELGKYSCARKAYIENSQKHGNPEPIAQLARLQVRMQETQAAMVTFGSYFRKGGKNADAAFLYGQLLEQAGQDAEALRMYQTSIDARPEVLPIAATGALVRIMMKQGRYEDAQALLVAFHSSAENAKGYLNTELSQIAQALTLYRSKTKLARRS